MRRTLATIVASLALVLGGAPAASAEHFSHPMKSTWTSKPWRVICGVSFTVSRYSYELPLSTGTTVITHYVMKRQKCRTGTIVTIYGTSTAFIPAVTPAP